MSVRNIDLVTFENDSVLNQKSIVLPIGKASIRQTVILFAGILVTFLVFLTSDNLVISGLVFAVFLGLGLIGSKVMSLDQMIKSHLILLVRGTSLDVKPDYMEKKKKRQDIVNTADESKTRLRQFEEEHQQENSNGLVNKAISEIQSLFSKRNNNPEKQKQSKEEENSAEIKLDDQNILNISLNKNMKQNNQNDDEPINKLLGKLSKKNLTEHVTISIDGKKLEKLQYEIKSNNMISLVLDNDSYKVTATADDDKKQNIILKN